MGRVLDQLALIRLGRLRWPELIAHERHKDFGLDAYAGPRLTPEKIGKGLAYTDNVGYAISILPSGRESFSPDASYYDGPMPADRMRFIEGPPKFAAEVRSENDYTDAAEADLADKRADYFAAGTLVVWDVDPLAECVHVYRASDPTNPATYQRSDMAEAEPALPGWRVAVDWIFR